MTTPTAIIISPNGTTFRETDCREWLDQFPDMVFSHLEWESSTELGGYPLFYITADNGVLCSDCANKEMVRTLDPDDDQFHIVGCDINYEDDCLYCDHCEQQINSAYGE